jgi:hypothetical protein
VDSVFEVVLDLGGRAARVALLRELSGSDELGSVRGGAVAASELLESLIVEAPGPMLRREELWALSLGQRDRLLAAVHAHHFGDRIESVVDCGSCRKAFAVDFSLSALVSATLGAPPSAVPDERGLLTLGDGMRFRLPSAEDERAVLALPPGEAALELLRRCAPDGMAQAESEALQALVAQAGPVLDLELPARCALCQKEQSIHFDIVSFFFASLRNERPLLLREIHRLAMAYQWSQEAILRLPRSQRRAYVALVEAERGRLRAAS